MYVLDKIDLFGVNEKLKAQRIHEVLDMKIENSKTDMFEMIAELT